MNTRYQLAYTKANGAGVVIYSGDYHALAKRLETLRRPGTLRDKAGRIFGGVEENDGRCDDRRVRWIWWYESEPEES